MKYDDYLEYTTIKAIDITNTEEGKKYLEEKALTKEYYAVLRELEDMSRRIRRDGGGYDFDEAWSDYDAEILWQYSKSYSIMIYIKDGKLQILNVYYGGETFFYHYSQLTSECDDIIKDIKRLAKRYDELAALKKNVKTLFPAE